VTSVEKKELDLKKMLATVLKDKEKIEDTIEELDRYKRDALQKTWEKVNGYNDSFISTSSPLIHFCSDFGGIFAELLPGNFAKLQPPEGQDLMQGLEVKVQLGTVWKQSLTELSGGQRYETVVTKIL
jgi:structural maintenance of chromosome 2